MKKYILSTLIMVVLCIEMYAQTNFYIDPSFTGISSKSKGSIENPYRSWKEVVKMKDGAAYLQKRGTTDNVGPIIISGSNVTLGAYGKGALPIIKSYAKDKEHAIVSWKQNHITVKNLEVFAPTASSCIYFNKYNNDNVIDSCKVHGSTWGIRITSGFCYNHKILNTEVFDIRDDGIFIQDAKNIEIAGCYIHDVNQNWKSPETTEEQAGGDGIQFSRSTNWYIHHNTIDRSSTGNKFCIISKEKEQTGCVIEYNHLIAPKMNGTCVYFSDGTNLIIRYNTFEGNDQVRAIYHHSSGLQIYYNTFDNFDAAITSLNENPCLIYNNVFNNVDKLIRGTNVVAKNNIYNIKNSRQQIYYKMGKLVESNNHYTTGNPGAGGTTGDPKFMDEANGDFRLKSDSPCINKGADVKIKKDISNKLLTKGNRPDIGAFEFSK